MTLKSIHLVNIQSHKDSLFEFPETGIVRIGGGNSAGKSAVFKPLFYLMDNGIAKPSVRAGLVSKGSSYGEATYTRHDEVAITIHVTTEASTTWVSLSKPGVQPVRRYLADKSYRELLTVFGLHYNDKREICINYGSGDGPILFFTTSHRTNGEAVDMALTDNQANTALEAFTNTLKQAQEIRDKAVAAIPVIKDTLAQIQIYDVDEQVAIQSKLIGYFNVLNNIYIPNIPEIEAVPEVKLLSVYKPTLPEVVYPKVYDIRCNIPDITGIAREVNEVLDGRCPTCGRRLLDAG